ncbi:MAG: M16 family metallopeptidase [Microcoleaceae cyanobacterium]
MTSTLTKPASVPGLNAPTFHYHPNGLTIVAEQLPVEAVNLNVWVNTGSAIESDDINGMAHFLEHMVFKGTSQLASGEFERRIEERGAVTNAATSQDYTHFYITTAPQDFAYLTPLQLDVVFNPSIPEAAFERERLVVLEEIRRSEDNPGRRSFRRAMETAFDRLPYRRPILGPAAVIEQVTPQQMKSFHQRYYQPKSATVVAVGNLPVEQLIATVNDAVEAAQLQTVDHEAHQDLPIWDFVPESGFAQVTRREVVDEKLQQARLILVWRTPGMKQLLETYPIDILAYILGQGRTARLVKDLREERGLVSSISASHMTQRLQGVFYISARLPMENLTEVEGIVLQHIQQLHQEWVSEAELTKIQTQVANRFVFGNEAPSDRAGLYGYYQTLVGDLTVALNYPNRIQSITPADLQQAAQHYLSPDAYGAVILKPGK